MTLQHGMDTERVTQIAGQLRQKANQMRNITSNVTRHVQGLQNNWKGRDAETFANNWHTKQRQLDDFARAIEAMAQRADQQVSEQNNVSNSGGTF